MKPNKTLLFTVAFTLALSLSADELDPAPWKPWIQKWASQSYLRAMEKTHDVKPHRTETAQVLEGAGAPRLHKKYAFKHKGETYEVEQFPHRPAVASSRERNAHIHFSISDLVQKRKADELLIVWTGAKHAEMFFTLNVQKALPGVYFATNGINKDTVLLDDVNAREAAKALGGPPQYNLNLVRDPVLLGLIAQAELYLEIYGYAGALREMKKTLITNEALWAAEDKVAPQTIFLADYHNLFNADAVHALPDGNALVDSGIKSVRVGLEGFISDKEVTLEEMTKHSLATGKVLTQDLQRALDAALASSPQEQKALAADIELLKTTIKKLEKHQVYVNGSLWVLVKKIAQWQAAKIDVRIVGIDTETVRTFGEKK